MTVIFYKMNSCGYCTKAEKLLADEIANKTVIIKSSSEAPAGVNGFPYFVNDVNGKSHMGYPGTKEALFEKLNVNFAPVYAVGAVGTVTRENFMAVGHVGQVGLQNAPIQNNNTHKFWLGIM
jgi:glutaredoxin